MPEGKKQGGNGKQKKCLEQMPDEQADAIKQGKKECNDGYNQRQK